MELDHGMGVVPEYTLARRFRDEAGLLHQASAKDVQSVLLMLVGYAMKVK